MKLRYLLIVISNSERVEMVGKSAVSMVDRYIVRHKDSENKYSQFCQKILAAVLISKVFERECR